MPYIMDDPDPDDIDFLDPHFQSFMNDVRKAFYTKPEDLEKIIMLLYNWCTTDAIGDAKLLREMEALLRPADKRYAKLLRDFKAFWHLSWRLDRLDDGSIKPPKKPVVGEAQRHRTVKQIMAYEVVKEHTKLQLKDGEKYGKKLDEYMAWWLENNDIY